ncbi:hypothetical protein PT2222_50358 [Paraburkholderia tropica]
MSRSYLVLAVALVGTLDERIDKGVRDVMEHRPDDLFENDVRKLVMQREFDLAGIGAQRREAPGARELLERTVRELHIDTFRACLRVARGEVLLDTLEVDVDLRLHTGFVLATNLDAAAPRQEVGVVVDVGDEVEHLFRRMANQHGFLDIRHKLRNARQG